MAVNSLIAKGSLSEQFDGIFGWLAANPLIAAIMGVVIWIGIMVISCQTSIAYYKKRDF